MKRIPEGVKAYFRAPFSGIVWMMETYAANRARLRHFMAKPRVATLFKSAVIVTFFAWLLIAVIAKDEDGKRLTDAVKELWSEAENLGEERKARQLEIHNGTAVPEDNKGRDNQ